MILFFIPYLIFLLIISGLIFLTLKVSKRTGHKKIGIGISILIVAISLSIPSFWIFDGFFFSKNDAKTVLEESGIFLIDDIKFESKSITGIMDSHLEFEISISDSDKELVIEELKKSKYRIEKEEYLTNRLSSNVPRVNDTVIIRVFDSELSWNISRLNILTNGYIRTDDFISISKGANSICMERME